jgi:hypothetical protein
MRLAGRGLADAGLVENEEKIILKNMVFVFGKKIKRGFLNWNEREVDSKCLRKRNLTM